MQTYVFKSSPLNHYEANLIQSTTGTCIPSESVCRKEYIWNKALCTVYKLCDVYSNVVHPIYEKLCLCTIRGHNYAWKVIASLFITSWSKVVAYETRPLRSLWSHGSLKPSDYLYRLLWYISEYQRTVNGNFYCRYLN